MKLVTDETARKLQELLRASKDSDVAPVAAGPARQPPAPVHVRPTATVAQIGTVTQTALYTGDLQFYDSSASTWTTYQTGGVYIQAPNLEPLALGKRILAVSAGRISTTPVFLPDYQASVAANGLTTSHQVVTSITCSAGTLGFVTATLGFTGGLLTSWT